MPDCSGAMPMDWPADAERFLNEACMCGPNTGCTEVDTLHNSYVNWCVHHGVQLIPRRYFEDYISGRGLRRFSRSGRTYWSGIIPATNWKPQTADPEKVQRDLHEGALDAVRAEQELRQFLAQNSVILGFDRQKFNVDALLPKARAYVETLEHLHAVESRAIDLGVWG